MMKKLQILIALCVFAFLGIESVAQTALAEGDIAIIAYDTPSDDFAFVTLVELSTGTEIYFTDEEADNDFTIGLGEGHLLYTAPGVVPAGTVINYSSQQSLFTTVSASFAPGNSGDGLIAYQGTAVGEVTTFLYAVGEDAGDIGTIPGGFTSIVLYGSDDGEYGGTRTGTKTDLFNAITLSSNWTTSGSGITPIDLTSFTISGSSGNPSPSITNISNSPTTPESTDAVTITADVTDADGVASVTLEYGFSTGVYDQTPIAMTNSTGDTYTASIAAQADGTTVFYRIVATDSNATAATTNSAEQSYTVTDPVPAPSLIITEVADPGDVFQGRFVEVYNNGMSAIDFSTTEVHIAIQANGGNISSTRLTGTLNAGDFYVIGNSSNINTQYGIPADLDFGSVTGNGDDGYFLYVGGDENSGTLFDAYGVLNQNGSGQAWDYENSRAVRNSLADNPSATWQAASWTITAANIADMTPGAAESIEFVYDGTSWTPNAPSDVAGKSTTSDDITINAGTIAFLGDVDARNITVQDGASLDLGANSINLTGDLTTVSTGSISGGEATLNFAGVNQQEINVSNLTVENLIVNTSNGLTLNTGRVNIEGSLDLTNGVLTTNNNLTMKSSAGKSAVLLEVTSGSISGNVTVEQFYPGQRAFRFVSSPVTMDGTIFTNWQQNGLNLGDAGYVAGLGTQITGGNSTDGFDQSTSNNPSAFYFDNETSAWTPVATTNDATNASLNAGDAVRLYIRGDRSISLTTETTSGNDTKLTTTGTLAIGDVVVTDINSTDGNFSFIGNPYQAQVDLVALLADATATEDVNTNTFYVWDPTINPEGAYVAYNVSTGSSVVGSDVNQFIQPNQAFFIATNDDAIGAISPSITFKESFKSSSSSTTAVYSTLNDQDLIRISLIAGSEQNTGKARDGIILQFSANGSNAIDEFDAIKLTNLNENLSVVQGSVNLTISSLQNPVDGQEIQLGLSGLIEDSYTFQINNTYNGSQNVYLNDAFLNENILLNSGMNLITRSFDVNDSNTLDLSRFKLVFSDQTLSLDRTSDSSLSVYPNPLGDSDLLHVSKIMSNEPLNVEVYSSNGQLLKTYENKSPNAQESLNIFTGLKKGVYLVALRQLNSVTTIKLIKK